MWSIYSSNLPHILLSGLVSSLMMLLWYHLVARPWSCAATMKPSISSFLSHQSVLPSHSPERVLSGFFYFFLLAERVSNSSASFGNSIPPKKTFVCLCEHSTYLRHHVFPPKIGIVGALKECAKVNRGYHVGCFQLHKVSSLYLLEISSPIRLCEIHLMRCVCAVALFLSRLFIWLTFQFSMLKLYVSCYSIDRI